MFDQAVLMGSVEADLDQLRSEDLAELPDARIEEDFAELQRLSETIEREKLRRLAAIDRRGSFRRDGHLSSIAWLADRFRMSWGVARDMVKLARGLDDMPGTRDALDASEISMSAVRLLVALRDADPTAFSRCEDQLVEAARIHSVRDLQRVGAYWRQTVDQAHAVEGDDHLRQRRRLHASPTLMGMVRVDGDLDPETGEAFLTALRAIMDADTRSAGTGDDRTPPQRRADALGELSRQWLDRGDRPSVGSERPHVTVTVDLDSLRGGVGGKTSELDHAGPIGPDAVRRIACDASIMRVVMTESSEPLDIGRRTPVVPPGMRRAIIARDRGCRFPGCDRPHPWCDAHHVVHWADGGSTAVGNLVLLCRRHHGLIHLRRGFRLDMIGGRPIFRRTDGSLLEDRAPPGRRTAG